MVSLVPLFSNLKAGMQSSPYSGMDSEVVGGKRRQLRHPWKRWGTENLHEDHLVEPLESYETLEEHIERLLFMTDARNMNETNLVLSMMGTKGENSMSNGVA